VPVWAGPPAPVPPWPAKNAMPFHQKDEQYFYLFVIIKLLLSFDFWVKLMDNYLIDRHPDFFCRE
jgi:hypothetical protein